MKTIARCAAFVSVFLVAGCDDGYLRGAVSKSSDGKTYFTVIDDNGGHCGPLKLDGVLWTHRLGELIEIKPGEHAVECGADIPFEIPQGVVFKFDYWGP